MVLITGCAQGIGLAACKLFLEQGHRVAGLDIQPCPLSHPDFLFLHEDVRDTEKTLSGISHIVNNAGVETGTCSAYTSWGHGY